MTGLLGRDLSTISVVAHRGSSEDVPEHTLPAYRRAIADGADAVECDVRLTRDGHLVCVHDRRVERTSNGRGTVSTLELAELAALDWASWRPTLDELSGTDVAADLDPEHRAILTFARLCETIADAGRRVEIAVEAKHPTRYGAAVERRLVDHLRYFGWDRPVRGRPSPVRYMSFSSMAVRRVQAMAPHLPTVLLFDRIPLAYRDGVRPLGVPIVGPSVEALRSNPEYVGAAQRNGARVHVWTVDRTEDVQLVAGLGVDAIITNRPRKVLNLLGR